MEEIFCIEDQEFFLKEKTGIQILRPKSALRQRGDLYVCPVCKKAVLGDMGKPF
jgi:hypothetical protein